MSDIIFTVVFWLVRVPTSVVVTIFCVLAKAVTWIALACMAAVLVVLVGAIGGDRFGVK